MSAAKLPILNPNKFNLWKMRINQYFLMTDWSLWEVILNDDSPVPTRVIEGVVQPIAPTTTEQRLVRRNKLKDCGTLLIALPDKHMLMFNIHKDAKAMMEAIEKRFGGNKETKKNAPSFVQPTEQVKTPRPSIKPIENSIPAANHKTTTPKPTSHGNSKNRKACFVLLPKSKLVPLTTPRQVTTVVSPSNVTRPRPAKTVVTKPHSPPRRHITHSPSPKASTFPPKVTAIRLPWLMLLRGNPHHALKDKGVIDTGYLRHMTGNMSYLSDFEEINGGYVAPNGGKISSKGKIRTGKLDFDDVYFVKELKFNLFSVSHMCDKKNNILFTDTECIVLSPEFKLLDENQVLLRVSKENNMYNVELKKHYASFEVKEPEFVGRKPEFEVHVYPSSSAQTKKHDDKTTREAKGNSPIELSTGYRNLSA
nr:ribonuclease H-like domain-containing protein [Tanacetum cinerariifolium]